MSITKTRCHQKLIELLTVERKKAGIRQTELARKLKQRQNWVSRLENGQRGLNVCEFILLSKVIGFDPYVLLAAVIGVTKKKA
jgi:transcriptional regulator with XRE-family HTH domain